MAIDTSLSLEPYKDKDGGIGFQEVHADYIKNHNQADWMKIDDNKQVNDLDLKARTAEILWKLPNEPEVKKYKLSFEERYAGMNLDGPQFYEVQNEWIMENLKEIHIRLLRFFKMFIYMDDERMYSYLANLTISTYFRDQFRISPISIFNGVQGSGKTTLLNALKLVCYRAYLPSSYTAAACISLVHEHDITLLLDEGLNNLRADRGGDLYGMLLSAYSKETAGKIRTNPNGGAIDIHHYYTNVVLTTRGADMPEDLRSRAFVYTMGLPGLSTDLQDVLYYDDVEYLPGIHPDEIRTDLYALRALTLSAKGTRIHGIWLDSFRNECNKQISTRDRGNYLYGYIHDIPNAPRIMNRAKDLTNVYYTLGLATDSDEDMIKLILDNEEAIDVRNNETIEAVLFTSLHDLIVQGYKDMYSVGTPQGGISEKDLRQVCENITLKKIRETYTNIRMDYDGWEKKEVEDSRTLTAKFRTMRIPYKPGAARINFLDPYDPQFLPSLKAAINNYCPRSERGFYEGITNPKANPLLKDSNLSE